MKSVACLTIILTICNIILIDGQECCEEYCYEHDIDRPQSRRFSTKTAYQIVRGLDSSRQYIVPNCEPVKFWLLSRHGTRYPNSNNIKSMGELRQLRDEVVKNYEIRRSKPDRGALCNNDLNLLKNWNLNLTSDLNDILTQQGWEDMKYLAKHYQRLFPNVLRYEYSEEKFLFRHTDTQRTEKSFRAFADGLFGDDASDNINPQPNTNNDTILNPYNYCPGWAAQNKDSKLLTFQLNMFKNSTIYNKMLSDVSRRLSFKYTLKEEQIETIWDMCRFDQAWQLQDPSPWCIAFTPNNVKILEYKEDLKYYYKSGYGSELNTKISCSAVKDMVHRLESTANPTTIAYFTHSSAVHFLLVALGAVKDNDALRADNYYQMQRRLWKISEIGPFAANLAAIKYECPIDAEKYKVIFFLNEKPIDFKWCNVGLCNWSDVKSKYQNLIGNNCASFCMSNSAIKNFSNKFFVTMFAFIFVKLYYFC